MPGFCVVLCFILSEWISLPWLMMWWIGVALASVGNGLPYIFEQRHSVDTTNIDRWITFRGALGFAHNAIWTIPAYVFWPYCSEIGQLLMILIYACTLAGGVALVSPSPRWAVMLSAPLAIALVAAPLANGNWLFNAIALLSVGYIAFMGHLGHELFKVARNALLLAEEKADLIEQLSKAKQDSDDARQRAEDASRSKSDFLANMSHELRTPLNAVLGFSEMIKNRVWGDQAIDRYADYAESIHASGAHLLQLINDILDLAKIEAGKFELNEERIELISVARQAMRLVEPQVRTKGVRALIDASKDVWVIADERAMRQVMANLLSNAVKFTPKDGTITVAVEHRANEGVCLTVRDSGVGIRPEDLPKVMEKFGQARHTIRPTERGTGLGLPIVKGLVTAHGGDIRLESKVNIGTAVTVILPESRLTEAYSERALPKIA